jgi:hypothetical protein
MISENAIMSNNYYISEIEMLKKEISNKAVLIADYQDVAFDLQSKIEKAFKQSRILTT